MSWLHPRSAGLDHLGQDADGDEVDFEAGGVEDLGGLNAGDSGGENEEAAGLFEAGGAEGEVKCGLQGLLLNVDGEDLAGTGGGDEEGPAVGGEGDAGGVLETEGGGGDGGDVWGAGPIGDADDFMTGAVGDEEDVTVESERAGLFEGQEEAGGGAGLKEVEGGGGLGVLERGEDGGGVQGDSEGDEAAGDWVEIDGAGGGRLIAEAGPEFEAVVSGIVEGNGGAIGGKDGEAEAGGVVAEGEPDGSAVGEAVDEEEGAFGGDEGALTVGGSEEGVSAADGGGAGVGGAGGAKDGPDGAGLRVDNQPGDRAAEAAFAGGERQSGESRDCAGPQKSMQSHNGSHPSLSLSLYSTDSRGPREVSGFAGATADSPSESSSGGGWRRG